MLTIKEKTRLAGRWHRYFESLVYVECLAHGIKKTPVLEIQPDNGSYQHPEYKERGATIPSTIHIGYGLLEAKTPEDLFAQIHHLLGHELQHLFSSTDKDWDAAHKLCFREACQRLSMKAFGKTRRLVKDSDYEAFFRDLAGKGIFVNQEMIMNYANFVLNVLEDGRIENIRTINHPGFGKYRKVFRGQRWLEDDFRDEPYFTEDPADLGSFGELAMILGQLYPLATLGIYQRGFLSAYGGTDAHDLAASFIPEISSAVLAKTCKGCMDQGRSIFNRLLDRIIDVCTVEADADALQKFLESLLQKLLEDNEKMQMSASPKTEEKGSGLPSESVMGHTELELEVDKETYEKLKEESDPDDEANASVRIKVKCEDPEENEGDAGEDPSDADGSGAEAPADEAESSGSSSNGGSEGEECGDSSSAGSSGEEADDEANDNGPSASDGEGEECGEDSSSGNTDTGSDEASGESSGAAVGNTDSNGKEQSEVSTSDNSSPGHNNVVSSAENSHLSDEELASKLEKAMEDAAKANAEFALAEADARLDEKFSEAAKKLSPVAPTPISLGDIDAKYGGNVRFHESTRKYSPTGRLPMELENKGKSLDRKIDQLIKNKQEPDLRFLKSGLLDTRRIANLAMGDIDVFKKKGEPVKSDVAAFLLMDNSGSMGNGPGSTRYACCNAFAVLEEGFKEHMPLKIAAFDASGNNAVQHEVIKEFDEIAPANLSFNFRDLGRGGWGNKDGYSIRVAAKQLAARQEKDKILIVASDGFPTDYSGGFEEGCADVKSAVQDARKAGLRVIGMYMYHDQDEQDFAVFRDMYGPEIIFASLDEIEDELTRILQRYFH